MMPGQQKWECVHCNVINTHGDPPCCEEATKSILAFDQRFPSQRVSHTRPPIFKVPRSISHCGHCGQHTLKHDDDLCRYKLDVRQAQDIIDLSNKTMDEVYERALQKMEAGAFDCQRLIDIKQGVDHLWEESATWPRVSWWKRAMNRVRSWF